MAHGSLVFNDFGMLRPAIETVTSHSPELTVYQLDMTLAVDRAVKPLHKQTDSTD